MKRRVSTDKPFEMATALAAGLIAEIIPTGTAARRASNLPATIPRWASLALREAKANICDASSPTKPDPIRAERQRFIALLGSADKTEGIAAFQEKRAVDWKISDPGATNPYVRN